MNLNSILIEGDMLLDPVLKKNSKGSDFCGFVIRSNGKKNESFFNIRAEGELARTVCEKGKAGRGLRIVGLLCQDRKTGKDGKLKTRVVILAEHVEFRPAALSDPRKEEKFLYR